LLLQVACGAPLVLAANERELGDRIAELEATTTRSANHPLQLNIYAQTHFYDPTIAGFPCTFDPDPSVCGGDPARRASCRRHPGKAWWLERAFSSE
jgi:hypothetical protein